MSLGRNITKKSSRNGMNTLHDGSKRHSVSKHKISSPVALLSTTNMLSYNAPTLRNSLSAGSISSSSSSASRSASPTSIMSPLGFGDRDATSNRLSSFFVAPLPTPSPAPSRTQSTRTPVQKQRKGPRPRHPSMPPVWPPTAQPPKELHSARALQQQQQQQHHMGAHPFGAELAQVAEMAEEIAGLKVVDAEEEFMVSRGLHRFRAVDYLEEIWQGGVFEDQLPTFNVGWI